MCAAAPRVSVVIPTQRRPGPLALAVGSVLAQRGVDPALVELVIADNDATPSAGAFARTVAQCAPFPVRYVHEPQAGVANVRNAALTEARGGLVAFLDDDEEAPEGWLAALLDAQTRFDADVVFGPVRGRALAATSAARDYLQRFFSRPGIGYTEPPGAGVIDGYFGCGNSLLRRASLASRDRPFDVARNQIGGEDDLLFGQMAAAGARFVWAPDAWVWEDPAPERQTLGYALRRAFAYGQGPTVAAVSRGRPARAAVWMAQGAVQASLFGLLAAGQWATGRPGWPMSLDRAARGLGKLLWWRWFKISFYGRSG